MEHQGPGSVVQPIEADDLALAHEGAVGFLLHLRQHGQLQGILVLPQAVAAGHGRVAVGQVVPLVVHQTGHVALQPTRGQDVCHEIVELNQDGKLPQWPLGCIQKLRLEAHQPLPRRIKIFGRRHPGDLGSRNRPGTTFLGAAVFRPALPSQVDLADPRQLSQMFQKPLMVVFALLTAAGFGKILHPLDGLAQPHIHGVSRPFQAQNGGLLPFLKEAGPDIKIAQGAHDAEKKYYRQHQEDN